MKTEVEDFDYGSLQLVECRGSQPEPSIWLVALYVPLIELILATAVDLHVQN